MSTPRTRRLTFEPLEVKCSPTTLLLFFAPLDETEQVVVEEQVQRSAAVERVPNATFASEPGLEARIPSQELLVFIAQNTRTDASDLADAPDATKALQPGPLECQAADEMMRATDTELRSLIVARREFWM